MLMDVPSSNIQTRNVRQVREQSPSSPYNLISPGCSPKYPPWLDPIIMTYYYIYRSVEVCTCMEAQSQTVVNDSNAKIQLDPSKFPLIPTAHCLFLLLLSLVLISIQSLRTVLVMMSGILPWDSKHKARTRRKITHALLSFSWLLRIQVSPHVINSIFVGMRVPF